MLKRRLVLFLAALANTTFADSSRPWDVEVELGAIATTGNTETTSVNAKLDAKQNLVRFNNEYIVNALFKEDDVEQHDGTKVKEKTAEKYLASAKSSYHLSDANKSYLFAIVSHTYDQFGAYRNYSTFALGYGDWLYATDKLSWFAEAGPGYFRGEKVLEPENPGDPIMYETEQGALLRLATELDWSITPTSEFKQKISVESSADNTRTVSETSLAASITNAMQMKLTCSIANDTKVAPGKKKTDTTTSATLVYKF